MNIPRQFDVFAAVSHPLNRLWPSHRSTLYLWMRVLVAGGVLLRIRVHKTQIGDVLAIACAIWLSTLVLAALGHTRQGMRLGARLWPLVVALDVLAISLFYWSTGTLQSDFYLFYCLPILVATEYAHNLAIGATFGLTSAAFAVVVFCLPRLVPGDQGTTGELLVRVFLPREVFFLGMTLMLALRVRRERDDKERSDLRKLQMQALLDSQNGIERTTELSEILENVLAPAVTDLGVYAAVGVLTPERNKPDKEIVRWFGRRRTSKPDPTLATACRNVRNGGNDDRAAPVIVRRQIVGAVAVMAENGRQQADFAEYLHGVAGLVAAGYERAQLFRTMREIGQAASATLTFNEELESMLDAVVGRLGFEHATISLVDKYRNEIRAVRGRSVPPGWINRSVHSLDDKDIQADIVRKNETQVPDDNDKRLDRDIRNRYHHERFVRVFAPITNGTDVVGTIEAGCAKNKKARVLTEHNVAAIKHLGLTHAESIERKMPQVLLDSMVSNAVSLVGADSGSIHVYRERAAGRQTLLVAYSGSVARDFQKEHSSCGTLGEQAISAKEPQYVNNVLESTYASAYPGVHALAAFPLTVGQEIVGVLDIHFLHAHTIDRPDLDLVNVLVPQIEIAIHNHLVFEDISRTDERSAVVTGLQNVLNALCFERETPKLLQKLAENVLYMLDAESVTLYQYVADEKRFIDPVIDEGQFIHPKLMHMGVQPGDILHEVIRLGDSEFISDAHSAAILHRPRVDNVGRERFVVREKVQSCIILLLKAPPDGEVVGCLFANYIERQDFNSDEKRGLRNLARAMASAVAIAVKTARLGARIQQDLKRTREEVEAFQAMDRSIVKHARQPDLKQTCAVMLDQALRVLKASVGDVTIWNPEKDCLSIVCQRGYPDDAARSVALGEGVVGTAGRRKTTECHNDVAAVDYFVRLNPETGSELAVPMLDQGERDLLGVVNIERAGRNAFSPSDKEFLEALAVQGAIAVHSVIANGLLERQWQHALSLGALAARIQRGHHDVDRDVRKAIVYRLLLTGLTAGPGLGFSRAMLFLADDSSQALRGALAIGPWTQQEAQRTWDTLDVKRAEVEGAHGDFLDWLLDDAEEFAIKVANGAVSDSDLSLNVRGMPLDADTVVGAHRDAASTQSVRPGLIRGPDLNPVRVQLAALYEGAGDCAIAAIPINAKSRLLGVVVLDKRFLYDERDIEPECAPILSAFAELAGIIIEGEDLRQHVADERQREDWRFATRKIAHNFKADVTVAAQHKTRIHELLQANCVSAAKESLAELDKSIGSMHNLVKEFDDFARPPPLKCDVLDIVELLREFERGWKQVVKCTIRVPQSTPAYVYADRDRLFRGFEELLLNADRAMRRDGTPDPSVEFRVCPTHETVVVEVKDNGPGVAKNIEGTLFEPFVTGYQSTGLGLAIVRELVEKHKGEIRYEPNKDQGACFIVSLPIRCDATKGALT